MLAVFNDRGRAGLLACSRRPLSIVARPRIHPVTMTNEPIGSLTIARWLGGIVEIRAGIIAGSRG